MKVYFEVLRFYIHLNPKKTIFLFALSGFLGALEYLEPYLIGQLIQLLVQDDSIHSRISSIDIFGYWIVLLILLIFLTLLLSLLTQKYALFGSKILWINYISGIYKHRNPIDNAQQTHSAYLLKTGVLGSESASELWQLFIQEQLQIVIGIVVIIPISFFVNPYLASVLFFLTIFAIFLLHMTFHKTITAEESVEKIEGGVAILASEIIRYQKLIQENSATDKEILLFSSLLSELENKYSSVTKTWAMVSSVVRGWFSLATLLMLIFGFFFYSSSKTSVGDLVTFVGFLGYMLAKVESLLNSVQRVSGRMPIFLEMIRNAGVDVFIAPTKNSAVYSSDYREIINANEVHKASSKFALIVCSDVSYRYPDAYYEVIKNLSFEVKSGEILGIRGKTGVGKSTLANILMGHLTPVSGTIFINQQNINDISRESLWKIVSILDQGSIILNRSIRDNILLGADNASSEHVIELTTKIGLHNAIAALPKMYDSIIGESGVQLSGGQKQLLCLARALLKKPKILILDEPTSGLDPVSEALILEVLLKLKSEVTIILISHKETTLLISDRVIEVH